MSLGVELAPGAWLVPDGEFGSLVGVCATAKAVPSAKMNTDVWKYFFMPVSPRLVERL